MGSMARRVKLRAAVVIVAASALAGCSDGIELNGRLLDAVGMSTAALGAKKGEDQLEQRAPLVMPPDSTRLPEPGSAPPPPVGTASTQSWPADKDHQRVADAADKARKQKEFCQDGNWRERAMGDDLAAYKGPQGTCGSIFTAIGGIFGGSN